jgi:uncharacterized membrane protein YcaP (DUF421 family)
MLRDLFQFGVSPWELVLRGTLIYWFLFFLFRFILRRDSGSIGLADILVIVLIADAAQNGMAGEYKSVGEAFVLIGTIAGWNYWIDWMSYRFHWFARFAEARTVPLVRHGRLLRGNLKHQMITEEELASQLRQSGIENLDDVKFVMLEPDGHFSVIRRNQETTEKRKPSGQPGAA